MARGRFISKEITIDKKVNSLSSPWSMLGFTWLLTHADVYGRTYGDPAVVRSMIFPRRPEVTVEEVEGFIKEWNDAGLINWYEAEGDMYIEFPNFTKHQLGLRYDKEAKSSIPCNPATPEELPEEFPELPESTPEKDGGNPESSGNCPEKDGLSRSRRLSRSRSLRSSKVEVEGSPGGDSNDNLLTTFCRISCLPVPAVKAIRDTWTEQLLDLKEKGVTENIIRRACKELTEKGTYRITSPKSIVKACDVVIAEKKRKDDEGYVPIGKDSPYSEAVRR